MPRLPGVLLGELPAQRIAARMVGAAQRGKECGLGGHRDITLVAEIG